MRAVAFYIAVLSTGLSALAADGTATVVRGDLEIVAVAPGRVVAEPAGEVRIVPEAFGGRWHVREVLAPGSLVRAGEVVARVESRDLEEAIRDAEFDLRWAERDLADLHERLRIGAEGRAAALRARRALERAEARLEHWRKHDYPVETARAALDTEASEQRVQNARDELDQLLEMYGEDELVDETEQIVVARARWNLKYRTALHELRLRNRRHQVEKLDPERERSIELDVERKRRELAHAVAESEMAARDREESAERAERALGKRREKLARLRRDLEAMTVRAPAAGLLLHGALEGGPGRRFEAGTALPHRAPAFTVVDPDRLRVELSVPATEALRLKSGLAVRLAPAATGAEPRGGKVEAPPPFPVGDVLKVRCRPEPALPRPLLGTACEGTIVLERHLDALLVPLRAVIREGERTLCRKEGVPDPVPVTLGADDGERAVVLDGLAEGDVVVLPEDAE